VCISKLHTVVSCSCRRVVELHAVGLKNKAGNHAHLCHMTDAIVPVAAVLAQAKHVASQLLHPASCGLGNQVCNFTQHQQLHGVIHSHSTYRDIKASCCHISGNQNPGRVCLEPIQGLEALPLLHGSMQGYSGQPQQLQQGCHSAHCTDGIHKDQGAAWMLGKDVVQELIALSITALQAGLFHLDISRISGFSRSLGVGKTLNFGKDLIYSKNLDFGKKNGFQQKNGFPQEVRSQRNVGPRSCVSASMLGT